MPNASTDEIDDILTTSPGALVRHGSAVVGMIAAAMIVLSYFVQYPDVVAGRITLLTEDPPAPVLARADGLVERLFVRDGECVKRGALLGRVATTGDGDAMQALTEQVTDVEARDEDPSGLAVRLKLEPHTNLGSLHTTYVALMAAITAYEELERHDYVRQRTGLHNQQRASYEALNQQTRNLVTLLGRNVELAELRKGRDISLRTSGVLSHEATEASQGELLQRRIDLGLTRLSQINMVLQALQSENSFLDMELQLEDEQRERWAAVQAEFRRLQLEALQWETAHVMRAPVEGCVSLRQVWSDHQAVRVGDEVMVLLPSGSPVVGRIQLTQIGAGKVAAGQQVTIQPDGFPMYEFGVLHADVVTVSAMADEIGFVATVTLAQGLRTDQGIALDFRQGMQGTASVVTRERRLFERIFSQFYVALFADRVRFFR